MSATTCGDGPPDFPRCAGSFGLQCILRSPFASPTHALPAPRHPHCIGNTSLLPLRAIVPANGARILLKLESENPTGSMKDRVALAMIETAEGPLLASPTEAIDGTVIVSG